MTDIEVPPAPVAPVRTPLGRVLLDPNTLSQDGTIALSDYAVSEDGRYLAYGLTSGGSDWHEWKVRDVSASTQPALLNDDGPRPPC